MVLLFCVSFWCFKYVNGVACSLLSYCLRFIGLFDYIRTVQQMMPGSIVICQVAVEIQSSVSMEDKH
jgi:hypothetical protein